MSESHSHQHNGIIAIDGRGSCNETRKRETPRHDVHKHDIHRHQADPMVTMDNLGIAASSLCLVHCLAMPLVIGFLPLLGLQFLEGHQAHVMLAGFVLAFALLAVVPGYLKHKRGDILGMMIVGISLVLYATFVVQTHPGRILGAAANHDRQPDSRIDAPAQPLAAPLRRSQIAVYLYNRAEG